MKSRRFGFDHGMGVVSILVGVTCLAESHRLFPIRSSFLAGDHALPGLTGILMIILGFALLLVMNPSAIKVNFPERPLMIRLMTVLGILAVYAASIKILGYVVPTGVFGIPLFRMFGGYGWRTCIAASILCTAGLYGLFIFGLGMSFPKGLFF